MRANTMITLGASAAFGILAVLMSKNWIETAAQDQFASTQSASTPLLHEQVKTAPVIVADKDLNFGDRVFPEHVRLIELPHDLVPNGVFSDLDALFGDSGEAVTALTFLGVNEPLMDRKVTGPGGRGSLSAIISDGMRASTIRISDVAGVGGFVLPGDHVDVLMTSDKASGQEERRMAVDVILQNVKVLGIDQNADQASDTFNVVKTATLEVTPQQSQALTLAMQVGSLSLTLRPEGAAEITKIEAMEEGALLYASAPVQKRAGNMSTAAAPRRSAAKPAVSQTATITVTRNGDSQNVSVLKDITLTPSAPYDLAGAGP